MTLRVSEAAKASAASASERPALRRVLGVDLLARLLGISAVSVGRYSSGTRTTPDLVAARLRALTLMVGDLGGAYEDSGIRSWFGRPRTALGNRAPVDVLPRGWRPEDPEAQRYGAWRTH